MKIPPTFAARDAARRVHGNGSVVTRSLRRGCRSLAAVLLCAVAPLFAAQVDIAGPPGSGLFGVAVAVLPNGNMLVADPGFSSAGLDNIGAVYLYSASAELISTLTGSQTGDRVGDHGIVVLHNGDAVVPSPHWSNGAANNAGAVTWIDADNGIDGTVSAQNSLVGTKPGDQVGLRGVSALANGNYVVSSAFWSSATVASVGAVTWGDGDGLNGAVTPANSLVGTTAGDLVGGVRALANGNYLVVSSSWDNAAVPNVGAVTFVDGSTGLSGPVSPANSLVGTSADDGVGSVTELDNGNYVVASRLWDNGAAVDAGAATWGSGQSGVVGPVSADNSLVGASSGDWVGASPGALVGNPFGTPGVVALSNGNYVVVSAWWDNGAVANVGAVTFVDGAIGLSGLVSPVNSLVGATESDYVGFSVAALSQGNYVVGSSNWHDDAIRVGAATWADGENGLAGPVTAANSLVGDVADDGVGAEIAALGNGHYVVTSPTWHNATGAVTWGNGESGLVGTVSVENSLVGAAEGDGVGFNEGRVPAISALDNGNYVVASTDWRAFGLASSVGAATWRDGSGPAPGVVSEENSLVGSSVGDLVGHAGIFALHGGNYVVISSNWDNGAAVDAGAVTWGNGTLGTSGTVSAQNSLVGTQTHDQVGDGGAVDLGDGHFVVVSESWSNADVDGAGAATFASSDFRLNGAIRAWNSVRGEVEDAVYGMPFAYDPARKRLAVGRPSENLVSLIAMDQVFADPFE